jgi:hypothetical protein
MKKMKRIIIAASLLLFMAGCDKRFEEINTNPYAIKSINDPGMLLTNILRNTATAGNWDAESTIIQHFVLPYNLGATMGFNFNDNNLGQSAAPWGVYLGVLRTTHALINYVKDNPARSNLYNMARIWRAYHYMWLVDHYGDVPYTEAERGQSEGLFYPKYDKGADIYLDLRKEIKEATDALDASKDNNSRFDIFVPSNATTATEITLWKRLGYSLLLRLGMRYTKIDENKAKEIVREAYTGGVMQSTADDIYVRNTNVAGGADVNFTNGRMGGVRGTNPYTYHVAEPIVTTLKNLRDPRLKFIAAYYSPFQSTAPNITNPDTTTDHQFGFPVGYLVGNNWNASAPGFRQKASGETGEPFSQLNYNVVAHTTTPSVIITNAQTQLLLAEAAYRGYLTGLPGVLTPKQYYEAGIISSMDAYAYFPNTAGALPTATEKANYLANPGVAYNDADALRLINTQYWIDGFNNGHEAWCNWRRSGFPVLQPNLFNNNLNGGFIRRFVYPIKETTANTANYDAAVAGLGGPDFLTTRVFWDKP